MEKIMKKKKGKAEKKSKEEEEKQFSLVPRLRSEPWLTPASSNKDADNQDKIIDTEKVIPLNANEITEEFMDFSSLEAFSCTDSHSSMRNNDEELSELFDAFNMSFAENSAPHETVMDGVQSSVEKDDGSQYIRGKEQKRQLVHKRMRWNDRELKDLAICLQSQGFTDIKKVADFVKTKNEDDVRKYIRSRIVAARKDKKPDYKKQRGRPVNKWTAVSHEDLQTWPNIRKWKKLAYEQILKTQSKDYSREVISSLCKRFYDEEEEPADPQVINVKLIYKYLMDCMVGQIPPQLPPKESSLVLDMLREVRLMPIAYDFEQERKFLQEFKAATSFKPFDELKKRCKRAPDSEVCGPNTVSVPEELFLDLKRHQNLVQSFNPLVTPVWMLQKEQEYLENYSEAPDVYLD